MRAAARTVLIATTLALAAAASPGADKTQTASGTIARIDAARQTLVVRVGTQETSFLWNADTKINGVLAPEARVTIRYAPQADGQNLAYQISVGR